MLDATESDFYQTMPALAVTHGDAKLRTDDPGPARPLLYAAVVGDILGTFRWWQRGERDPSQVAITYSAQFYDLCRSLGRRGIAMSFADEQVETTDNGMTVLMQRQAPVRDRAAVLRGPLFHLAMLRRSFALLRQIRRFAPGDAIVMDGAAYWFPLALAGRDVRLFISAHTRLWEEGRPTGRVRRIVLAAEGWFLRNRCAGVLVVSEAIGRQIAEIANCPDLPIRVFKPTYEAQDFDCIPPASAITDGPFRILFAGRIEANKGVFDLVAMAATLRRDRARDFRFTICGSGSALDALRARITEEGLDDQISCPGDQQRNEIFGRLCVSHCVIVPTRSDFLEGFNKVVVEAVLAGRPVITSRVCPALEDVRAAAIEAEPDNIESYVAAIRRLMDKPTIYAEKVRASRTLATAFTDRRNGWLAQAEALLAEG